MKYKKIILVLTISAASLFSFQTFAQSSEAMSKNQYDSIESSQATYKRDQVQTQKDKDAEAISDAKADRADTKARAKESARIDDEAQDAAKQSKNALKAEKKAQKLRKKADKQAEKAETAREKSDLN
jgi:hypothetical protein